MFVLQGVESLKMRRRECSFLGKFSISLLGSSRSHPAVPDHSETDDCDLTVDRQGRGQMRALMPK